MKLISKTKLITATLLVVWLTCSFTNLSATSSGSFSATAQIEGEVLFRAGAYAVDISPPAEMLPISTNGGITARYADQVIDRLFSRSLVLDDGSGKIAITVVDVCIMDKELVDEAKELARRGTGIPVDRMLVSATHTHSAPAVTGAHGTEPDLRYRRYLIGKIAEGIEQADRNRVAARVGWGVSHNDDYVFCRRWFMSPGTARTIPFTGHSQDQVQMNPGHDNSNRIGPTGPVDTAVTVLSVQTREGRPLALVGNYSTHYAGAPALSADYFGVFARRIAEMIGADSDSDVPFVGMMSNGTSGDANCMNFGQSARNPFDRFKVGDAIARTAVQAYEKIRYYDWVPIDMSEKRLQIAVRMPSEEEVKEAQKYLDEHMKGGLPGNLEENYARETVLLSQMPPYRELKLQAIRIGGLGVTASPAELYGTTGLKVKADSPLQPTMNISLANGFVGYVPPPEHHRLGGYTTWRARSSCLEVRAEPQIRSTLQELLESVARPRQEHVWSSSAE